MDATPWEVFYTPHTDDESIGMAGSIARAIGLGHRVLVVLVTDNEPSTRGRRIFPGQENIEACRMTEWCNALRALGVSEYEVWGIPERQIKHDPFAAQTEILARIHDVHDRLQPVQHHSVWGAIDIHRDSGRTSLSHVLCSNALAIFAVERRDIRITLYGVYIYSQLPEDRFAPTIRTLTEQEHARKRDALQCFHATPETIGYGYSSVPELMDAASEDPREFLIEVQYVNGSGGSDS